MTVDINQNIQALRQHIDLAADQLAQSTSGGESGDKSDNALGALIYLGNHQDAMPRDLIIDPILLGDEIRTWMLMKIHVANPMAATRIPSQEWLGCTLQCSRPIVSRHMQVLRALRWITLCAEVRGPDGRYRGVVYAQHDQPLDIAETLYLDPGYIDWLEQPTTGGVLKRLQAIKGRVLTHTDYLVVDQNKSLDKAQTHLGRISSRLHSHAKGDDPLQTHLACVGPGLINAYSENHHVEATHDAGQNPVAVNHFHKNPHDHVKDLYMVKPPTNHVKDIDMVKLPKKPPKDHVKDFYMDERSSSSSSSYNITTTTPLPPLERFKFPESIRGSQRQMVYAAKKVCRLPEEKQQFALDYLADRIKAGESGAEEKPVANPLQYLEWIVRNIIAGTLPESSYGIRPSRLPPCSLPTQSNQPCKPTESKEENERRWRESMRKLGFEVDPATGAIAKPNGDAKQNGNTL